MLLDEIIAILSDPSRNLVEALLKTKILMRQIGQKHLADWVNSELNGYEDGAAIPTYRIASNKVYAHVVALAWQSQKYPLPTLHLEEKQKKDLSESPITGSIQVIEENVKKHRLDPGFRMNRPLPVELSGWFREVLQPGVNIFSLWCEVNMGDYEGIVVQVRSRLLDFALDLRESLGAGATEDEIGQKAKGIDTAGMFSNAIFGPNATINYVHGSANARVVTINNSKGDISSLMEALKETGVTDDDLNELAAAVKEDGKGGAVTVDKGMTQGWLLKMISKAGSGALKVGTKIFTEIAIAAIEKYAGI